MKKILKKVTSFILSFSLMLSMGQISNIKKTKADASFYYVDGRYFGDANGDGRISSVDLTMLRGFINGNVPSDEVKYKMDLNGDGRLSNDDLELIRGYLYEGKVYFPVDRVWYGDCNGDNKIDISDVAIFALTIRENRKVSESDLEKMDLNGDGILNQQDLDLIKSYVIESIKYFPVQNMLYKIDITTLPYKQRYKKGENIDTSGMIVKATKNNGAYKEVYGYSVNGYTNYVGKNKVSVSYYEGGVTKTASFAITVYNDITPQPPTPTPTQKASFTIIVYDDITPQPPTPTPTLYINSSDENILPLPPTSTPTQKPTSYWTSDNDSYSPPTSTPYVISSTISGGGSSISTKRPILDQEPTSSKRPILDQEPTSSKYPILTYTSSPVSTNVPNIETFTPEQYPEETYFPDWNPSVTEIPVSTQTFIPELGTTAEPAEIETNTEGYLTVSVSKITANAKGTTSVASVNVKTNKTGGFSVDNGGTSWLKVGSSSIKNKASSNVSFESDGVVYIFVSKNTTELSRTATLTITHENGKTKEKIKVSQEGTKLVLDVDSINKTADNNGSFYNNAISVKTSNTGAFTATVEDADWLKLSSKNTNSFEDGISSITLNNDAYIYLVVDVNNGDTRTTTVTITHESEKLSKEVTVTQMGRDSIYLQVDRETAYFDDPEQGISEMITVSADENTKWTATASEDWIKIVNDRLESSKQYASIEKKGKDGFYILVKENDTYKERAGRIVISAPDLESYEIYVQQVENEISIDSLLEEISVKVSKKSFKKGKTSKIKLVYPEGLYASDIKKVTFSTNKKKVATINSKGIIQGHKKGKAIISVKIKLENGKSKTFKAKITVDKRKVKLAKFK